MVRIVLGPPMRTIALMQFDDVHELGLADMDDTERRAELSLLASVLDALGADRGDVVIGLRGNVFYGARYRRRFGGAPEYDVGFSVPLEEWAEEALTVAPIVPPAPPPAPTTLAPGT